VVSALEVIRKADENMMVHLNTFKDKTDDKEKE